MALLRAPPLPPNLRSGLRSARGGVRVRCSAVVPAAPAAGEKAAGGFRWGTCKLQGPREEMEDDVLLRSDGALAGFSFAAVLDGHAGTASVQFLRNELYQECMRVLQGGLLLSSPNFDDVRESIELAFSEVDKKLLSWLDDMAKEDESGATATVLFIRNDLLIIAHLGDSCVVISRNGRPQSLTNFHRPYGNNRTSLEEGKRIRAAGGWIVDGRVCGEIAVSRAFGDARFKTKKNELLMEGMREGRWTEKFVSRIQFKGDLVVASPDIVQVELAPDVEFILVASDGLWDYMKSLDAVTFVRNQLRQHGDVQMASEALAQMALDQGSQDNISIVIVDLGRRNWRDLPVQGPNLFLELSQAFATVGIVSVGIWISSFLMLS